MKRTNLVLDADLLEQVKRLSNARTYSEAVDLALKDYLRRIRARRILELRGSGLWSGDLSQLREDKARRSGS
jgi:Arc/MetJ family transcription regulator